MRERIVCDSCCDFAVTEKSSSLFEKVPATICVGVSTLTDDKQFRQEALLAALDAQPMEPGMQFPDEQAYLDAFDCGAQELYVVTASATLGDHYETASRARRQFLQMHPAVQIHVFNTRTASVGELLAVRKISRMLRSGCGFGQIVHSVERYILEISTLFLTEAPQSLRAVGMLGPRRPFQPNRLLLQMDMQGQLMTVDGAPSEKAVERKLLQRLGKQASTIGKICLIAHCGCPEKARRLVQQLRWACAFSDIVCLEMGAVSALLLGRGGIALAF